MIVKNIKIKLLILYIKLKLLVSCIKSRNKTKYFCIGRNKTGTTSLKKAFQQLRFPVGYQRVAEKLYDQYYFEGNFEPIVKYCQTAQVFQDVPFSCPNTFKYLDKAYPESKFILTVRDDAEQWYQSIVRFHGKSFGLNGRVPPTLEDLKNAIYVRQGFMYNTVKLHGTPDSAPYNKEVMIAHYERHNREVIEYFKDRPEDLLIINIADTSSYRKFVEFLGVQSPELNFPWENKT
mgnify:CR=1 FL=1